MNSIPSLINDCFLHDKDRLRHDDALKLLDERLHCIADTEAINSENALGRIVSQNIKAPHNVPLHTNSAVDGYAFNHDDLTGNPLPITSRIAAGDLNPVPLKPNTAARIFTGAAMPPNADTVAMQEDCTEIDGTVELPQTLKIGANCRQAGEDLQSGDRILQAGTRLKPADLAAIATVGFSRIPVFKQLKVALFSNGNEMRQPGASDRPLEPGEVYDANQPLLSALCGGLPLDITPMGIIIDEEQAAYDAIRDASTRFDIIITTGGASRGDEDHMLTTLDSLGSRHLWQLAVKPGRPMMFGQIKRSNPMGDCLFFGLPGNPVAAMVCFLLYVRPALLKLAGGPWYEPPRFKVPALFTLKNKKPDRREFLRGILKNNADGTMTVDKFARDGSGLVSSLREADGLIEIPEDATSVDAGDLVSFIPFTSFS